MKASATTGRRLRITTGRSKSNRVHKFYINRGSAYNALGNYSQAIEDYSRAIEIKPGYFSEAYFNRGIVYINQGDYIVRLSRCAKSM